MFAISKQQLVNSKIVSGSFQFFTILASFLLFIFLLLLGLQVFGQSGELTSTYLPYENQANGIKIDYPSNWEKVDQGLPTFGENITVAKFSSPEDLQVHVSLVVDKLSPNTTLQDYTKENIDSASNIPSSIFSSNQILEQGGHDTKYNFWLSRVSKNFIEDIDRMVSTFQLREVVNIEKPIKWSQFKDVNLGISLEYPSGWKIERMESKFDERPEVIIADRSEGNFGVFRIMKPVTVDPYVDVKLATLAAQNRINDKGFKIIHEVNMDIYKINGKDTGTFLYTIPGPVGMIPRCLIDANYSCTTVNSIDSYDRVEQVVITIHKDKMYSFIFGHDANEFEAYTDVINHIFNSIKLTN